MKRILLVGAGHAHLAVLRSLKEAPLYGASIGLVSPWAKQLYAGMLPGVIAGHYRVADAQIDVAALAERAFVEFSQTELVALDADRRVAKLANGEEIRYDYASLNAGSLVDTSLPGAKHALAVKPFDRFMQDFGNAKRVAIVGAGAAGAELAMALRHAGAQVTLYSEKSTFSSEVATRVLRSLRRCRVDFRPGMPVTAIERGPVIITGPSRQEFDRVLLATGALAMPWLRSSGLATDEQGYALVHPTLQSVSHPEVFAVGDCATLSDAPHPRSGVFALRHGELLAQSLRNLVEAKPLPVYIPQPRALSLLTCGRRYAIAEWGRWTAEGRWAWWWKNRIDRRWIRDLRPETKTK